MAKVNYSIVNGAVKIEGIDGTNPVIYDNDIFLDTPDGYYNQSWLNWKDIGDAPAILWFVDNSVWKNVARKNLSNQTVTGDTYDFLLVSQNDWAKYAPMINNVMLNAQSYVPVTTTTPPPDPEPNPCKCEELRQAMQELLTNFKC